MGHIVWDMFETQTTIGLESFRDCFPQILETYLNLSQHVPHVLLNVFQKTLRKVRLSFPSWSQLGTKRTKPVPSWYQIGTGLVSGVPRGIIGKSSGSRREAPGSPRGIIGKYSGSPREALGKSTGYNRAVGYKDHMLVGA